jgi:hypothetical protein
MTVCVYPTGLRSYVFIIILLTANWFVPGGSGTTVRKEKKRKEKKRKEKKKHTYIQSNTQHTKLQTQ